MRSSDPVRLFLDGYLFGVDIFAFLVFVFVPDQFIDSLTKIVSEAQDPFLAVIGIAFGSLLSITCIGVYLGGLWVLIFNRYEDRIEE